MLRQSEKTQKTQNCHDAPSGQVLLAIRQFNSTAWFECHETLELLWIDATGEVRNLYQGIIQIAIALHHWRNSNFAGAISLLKGGRGYLEQVPQPCLWIDLHDLILQTDRVREQLVRLGQERMTELEDTMIPKIKTVAV